MLRKIRRGSTAKIVPFYVVDKSQSPPAPLIGLTHATAGLVARYYRSGDATPTGIVLSEGVAGSWTAGGFVAVPTVPGLYLLGLPDAALAAGDWVCASLDGVASLHCPPVLIELDAVDYQDAAGFGLSRVDAAVSSRLAPAVAGRALRVAASGHAGIDWADVANPESTVALTDTTMHPAAPLDLPANFALLDIDAEGRVTSASTDAVASSVVVGGYETGQSPAERLFNNPARKLDVAADGSVTAHVADKTGFVLAAAGLDMISVVDPGHPINWTTLPRMVAGLVGHATRKRTLAGGWLNFYAADGVTVAYAQAASDDGTTQSLGSVLPPA